MGKLLSFFLNIIFYFIGVGGLFYLIFWMGNLMPFDSINDAGNVPVLTAALKNLSLLVLFGLQHTVMARKGFKDGWTRFIPAHMERSIYVLISGLLCLLIAWQWAPINGVLWDVTDVPVLYYALYGLFFFGIFFLLSSTFLINHFELFGIQQGFNNLRGKVVPQPKFSEFAYYKLIRHPIYLGFTLILWSTPLMTISHLYLTIGMMVYIYVGIHFEEKDLAARFGQTYTNYKNRVPKLIPFTKLESS